VSDRTAPQKKTHLLPGTLIARESVATLTRTR
jgi:hypothetical protein